MIERVIKEKMDEENKKPRLVIVTDNFLPRWDGITRFLAEIIPKLSKEFSIVVIGPEFGPIDHPVNQYIRTHLKIPVKKKQIADFQLARFKYRAIKREIAQADVVFSQTIGPIGALGIIAAKRKRKPLISFIHNIETSLVPMAVAHGYLRRVLFPFMHILVRFLYRKPNLLITPSEWVEDHLSWEGIKTKKKVVRLGVDTKKFSLADEKEREKFRTKIGIEKDDIIIGQQGRLGHEKDLRTLLRGFIRVQARHKNVKFLFIGDGQASIRKMLEKREGVILVGKQDNVIPYLQALDIFVLTSLTETTCLSALEAMSCGLPIVSTRVGFVKDYITEGETGLFFPFKDTYGLARQVNSLIEDPAYASKIGKAGRKMVLENFDWDDTISGVAKILKDAVKDKF